MFACIYVPDFPVAAIVRAEPSLRDNAVAVLEGKPPQMRVVALNDTARLLGIEIGMTKLQAAIFAVPQEASTVPAQPQPKKKSPEIELGSRRGKAPRKPTAAVLRQRSPEQEQSSHAALLDVAHAFTPRVEDTHPDRLLLDLDGLERLYGPATAMARELASRVGSVGLECNIGVAANPDAAMHAACGFSGVTVLPAGEEARRLGVLPLHVVLESLDIASGCGTRTSAAAREREKLREQMLDTLERWGVRDFRMLALLPEHALAARLGEVGTHLQQLARGAAMRTLALCDPPVHFEEGMELESAVETLEPLSFLLNRLLEQLCARLEARALAVQELKLRLQLEPRVADEQTTTCEELEICAKQVALFDCREGNFYIADASVAGGHARSQGLSQAAAVGFGDLSARSTGLQTVDCSRAGTSAFGTARPVFAHHSRGRKAGDHTGSNQRHRWRTPSRHREGTGHASSGCISHGAVCRPAGSGQCDR